MKMRRRIEDKLLSLSITPNLKGFETVVNAVEYALLNKGCSAKEIYESAGSSYASVERRIRYSISKMDVDKWREMGGKGTRNSEFISTLAFIISREEEDEK